MPHVLDHDESIGIVVRDDLRQVIRSHGNGHERILDFVRDPGGEAANRFQTTGFDQAKLDAFQLYIRLVQFHRTLINFCFQLQVCASFGIQEDHHHGVDRERRRAIPVHGERVDPFAAVNIAENRECRAGEGCDQAAGSAEQARKQANRDEPQDFYVVDQEIHRSLCDCQNHRQDHKKRSGTFFSCRAPPIDRRECKQFGTRQG